MIRPQYVHVLYQGKIVKTGGPELAKEIQEQGYDWIKKGPTSERPSSNPSLKGGERPTPSPSLKGGE
jgi:hypothetical protein